MLTLQGGEPVVVDLGEGAAIELAPPSPRIVAAGRQASRRALDDDADLSPSMAMIAFSEGVLMAAITGWTGIGNNAGEALECTAETKRLALSDITIFDRLDEEYVIPMMARETEKNGSAASSDGISTEATAAKGTASSAAASKPAAKKTAKKRTPRTRAKKST